MLVAFTVVTRGFSCEFAGEASYPMGWLVLVMLSAPPAKSTQGIRSPACGGGDATVANGSGSRDVKVVSVKLLIGSGCSHGKERNGSPSGTDPLPTGRMPFGVEVG